ncbi:MAG: 16S rRNA (uracil(1498)-N(3))-methyltransferase [Actinobacteria bacterium]|nr:16S rRNA (uracil(1498)-N(3))-methyltransferase [Actinomycetota bacterium]
MAKPRFFINEKIGESVDIMGSDAKHIRDVLRLAIGDSIKVVDSEGTIAEVRIDNLSHASVSGKVINSHKVIRSLPEVYLFQGLPKVGKFDIIIRQATEIGASGISPVLTECVVVKVEAQKAVRKSDRWQKIVAEAAKQSRRTSIPKITGALTWHDAVEELKKFDQVIVFWEEEHEKLLFEVLKPTARSIALVVGPEGGLSENEITELKRIGAEIITLGESILRTETAGPVAVALVLYELQKVKKLGNSRSILTY